MYAKLMSKWTGRFKVIYIYTYNALPLESYVATHCTGLSIFMHVCEHECLPYTYVDVSMVSL